MIDLSVFDSIGFEPEAHAYTLGGQSLTSVTRVVERLKPPFDADTIAAKVARRDGRTVEAVRAEWEDKKVVSQQRGTLVHAYIDATLTGQPWPDDDPFLHSNPKLPEMEAFDAWWEQNRYHAHAVAAERVVGDATLGVAGTLDGLWYSERTGQYHIIDWKTNTRFGTDSRWQTLRTPFADLPECELSTYSLQVSLYRLILERNVPALVRMGEGYIVHLGRDGTHTTYRAHDLRARLSVWLLG